jgi:hypothetical protein
LVSLFHKFGNFVGYAVLFHFRNRPHGCVIFFFAPAHCCAVVLYVADFVKQRKRAYNAVRLFPFAHAPLFGVRVRSAPISVLALGTVAQVDSVPFNNVVLYFGVRHY